MIIHVARKPYQGSMASNALAHGVAGLHIESCRVPYEEGGDAASNPLFRSQHGYSLLQGVAWWGQGRTGMRMIPHVAGRWPANVLLSNPCFGESSRFFKMMGP